MSELNSLKDVYRKIDELYVNAKDSFYDYERAEFHLMVSSECVTLAECKMVVADEIIKKLEQKVIDNEITKKLEQTEGK